ncbi:hypothetical protein EDE12_101626 [Methylosinus sp. sav-2]|uniref:hypothetical protein n=1 Tax=Methylosinus sp. sav-2 TaxID=2485168 RepID=UPI00047A5715|nr:hypothetical protein [Methylosinus sp. sav-2]TDX67084.1 hypothetical protein EDE12_101626 [Methylosinus sp. sav-2]
MIRGIALSLLAFTSHAFTCHACAAPAAEPKSQYSSLQNCPATDRLKLANRTLERSGRTAIFHCAGVGGFSVYVVDDDPRSFLVLERGKTLYSLERPMASAFSLGNFPNVTGAKLAEWRLDPAGAPAGLIVRVAYQRADGAAASTLMVFDLRGEPMIIGAAKTNEEARDLIDGLLIARTLEEKLSRECNAIYVSLCKGFPPGPEMLGGCFDARPEIADEVPQECVADFQTNVENYHEAKGGH